MVVALVASADTATDAYHYMTSVKLKVPDMIITRVNMDARGNTLLGIDGLNQITTDKVDSRGLKISETDANAKVSTFKYDERGNMVSMRDARGTYVNNTYDLHNRLVHVHVDRSSGVVGTTDQYFAYDFLGNRIQASDVDSTTPGSTQTVAWTYDSLGHVLTQTQNGQTIVSQRDGLGNRLVALYPGDLPYTYTYDPLERLSSVTDGEGNLLTTYSYEGTSLPASRVDGNGATTAYSYNLARQLTQLTINEGATVLAGWQYDRSPEGRKLGTTDMVNPAWDETYGMDLAGRLVNHTRDTVSETWNLDKANNWGKHTVTDGATTTYDNRTHDATNALVTRRTDTYTYDAVGNILQDESKSYKWDFKDRLREVDWTGNSTVIANYTYDTDYHRLSKTVYGVVTSYLVDGDREAIEQTAGSLFAKTYVYGVYADELIAMQVGVAIPYTSAGAIEQAVLDGDAPGAAALILAYAGGASNPPSIGTTYFEQDDLHSTRLITDNAGLVTDTYAYDPYGAIHHLTGTSTETRLYTGRNNDPETGLYYYRTRYYSPSQGRFINRDTIGIWGDADNFGNAYSYTNNAPHWQMDPMGTCDSPDAHCLLDPNGDYEDCSWWNLVCHGMNGAVTSLAFALQPALTASADKALAATGKSSIPTWTLFCLVEGLAGVLIIWVASIVSGTGEVDLPVVVLVGIGVIVGCMVAFVNSLAEGGASD